ncbi:MAG: hypothetical protein ACJATT_000440 [Myxococcota bacterium]|jgi:hypothetical protein
MSRLALAVWLIVVVDQVEGSTALVEWGPNVFGTVSTEVLPADTREGDRVQVRVRARDLRPRDAEHDEVWMAAPVRRSRSYPLSTRTRTGSIRRSQ